MLLSQQQRWVDEVVNRGVGSLDGGMAKVKAKMGVKKSQSFRPFSESS